MTAATDRVARAVLQPGRTPAVHRGQLERLAREWPVLAAALAAQLVERGDPVPPEWRHFRGVPAPAPRSTP